MVFFVENAVQTRSLKQAVQAIFSAEKVEPNHSPIYFMGKVAVPKIEQKHLRFILDEQLNFNAQFRKKIIGKAKRGIGVIKFMSRYVTRDVLDQMYKLYVRHYLD